MDNCGAKFQTGAMSPPLSTLERLVIFAADESGHIPVPRAEKSNIKTIRTTLAQMKKKGLVCREKTGDANSLPYVLTESGRMVRDDIVTGRAMH